MLFRPEAIKASRTSHDEGGALITPPLKFSFLVLSLTFIFCGGIAFAAIFQFSSKETVRGRLLPNDGIVKVSPSFNGVISSIHTRNGEKVNYGDVVYAFENQDFRRDGSNAIDFEIDNLISEQSRLRDLISKLPSEINSEKERLRLRIARLDGDVQGLKSQIEVQSKLLKLENSRVKAFERMLLQESVAQFELDNAVRRNLSAQVRLLDLERQFSSAITDIKLTKQELSTVESKSEKSQYDLNSKLLNLEREISRYQREQSTVLKAPKSGIIAAMNTTIGVSARSPEAEFYIISNDAKYYAEIYVPSRAIQPLEEGLEIDIKLDAYPYREFGTLRAKVVEISQLILPSNDYDSGILLTEPSAVIRAQLIEDSTPRLTDPILLPGMTLSVDITTEQRSLLNWALGDVFK